MNGMVTDAERERLDDVEPGIRAFLRQIAADSQRLCPDGPVDLAERRRVAATVRERWARGGPAMATTADLTVGPADVPVRIHSPSDDRGLPAFFYLHGGGWTLFSVDTHDRLMREYAARAGVTVVGVDYSLSPEVRFPVALEEVLGAIDWARSDASRAYFQPRRIGIGGDSAGANLALCANLALKAKGEPVLDAMLLNYGAFDPEPRPSYHRYGGPEYMLAVDEMADFWDNYLLAQDRDNPLARPLLAHLHGLPPAYLCIAVCDILLDENRELADRLRRADVEVTSREYEGATHSFIEAVSVSALADEALAEASAWLREVLGR